MPQTDATVVLTTLPSADEAVSLIRALLDRRLIACGTLVPGARSFYRWEGKSVEEGEVIVLLKTVAPKVGLLKEAFIALHPYKVPELLAMPVSDGNEKYLEWIHGETSLALA